ncbi:hypothetical protein [Elongatibacter sediminis]|uniref:Uncharacterized protein n=1 Tax=Elongatibacter sediminis TaxID=3119006 RepID=A0AAW9R745_9GAMM
MPRPPRATRFILIAVLLAAGWLAARAVVGPERTGADAGADNENGAADSVPHARPAKTLPDSVSAPAIVAADDLETRFLLAAAQADLSSMAVPFAAVTQADSPLVRELSTGFEARFINRSEPLSPATGQAFIDGLVAIFRRYWTEALVNPGDAPRAAARLDSALTALLASHDAGQGAAPRDPADAYARVRATVRNAGYGISLSSGAPLHDLVVWKDETRKHYRVDLTDSTETVEVVFVDGLVSQGWRHFASMGLNATSGWTSGDVLYCVRWSYDPATEPFRVSYLKHEARHFADFRRYPELDDTTMEYRAKLTELAYANRTASRLLQRFTSERSAAGASAHARANDRVAQDMYREVFGQSLPEHLDAWSVVGPERINPAARRLLQRSTALLP